MTIYPAVFKTLPELLPIESAAALETETKARNPLLCIITGREREHVRDVTLATVRTLYPSLASTGAWFISDHPDEIPVNPPAGVGELDWYFGGGQRSLAPQPLNETDTDPLATTLRMASRMDLEMVCVFSPLTTALDWEIVLNLFLTGGTLIIGVTKTTDGPIVLPGGVAETQNLELLFSPQVQVVGYDVDKHTLSTSAAAIISRPGA